MTENNYRSIVVKHLKGVLTIGFRIEALKLGTRLENDLINNPWKEIGNSLKWGWQFRWMEWKFCKMNDNPLFLDEKHHYKGVQIEKYTRDGIEKVWKLFELSCLLQFCFFLSSSRKDQFWSQLPGYDIVDCWK